MIRSVDITNLMGFEHFANPAPFPGITVILGRNDMCKTALLKMLYAVGKSAETYDQLSDQGFEPKFAQILSDKLQTVYGVRNSLNELIRKNGTPKKISVNMELDAKRLSAVSFSYGTDTRNSVLPTMTITEKDKEKSTNYIFIPAKEVLTAFNTIKAIARKFFYPGWDDTTLDLIDLLDIPVVDNKQSPFEEVLNQVKNMFSGELRQINTAERFVYKKNGADFSLPLTAEGIKHIGILSTLILNGQLRKNSVLFLDEPEDNLHPRALRQLVKILAMLSREGVQVFMNTHNYFTLKQLQIEAQTYGTDVLCIGLYRGDKGTVEASFDNLRVGMPSNEIVSESLAMMDEEVKLELEMRK